MEIQRVIKEYLYAHKFDNLRKMNKFLEIYKLPKPTKREINHFNKSVFILNIESIIKTFQKRHHQAMMVSLVNYTKH